MMADIVRPLALAASLLGRFWPQLLLIGALGSIVRDLLLNAAVSVGLKIRSAAWSCCPWWC